MAAARTHNGNYVPHKSMRKQELCAAYTEKYENSTTKTEDAN